MFLVDLTPELSSYSPRERAGEFRPGRIGQIIVQVLRVLVVKLHFQKKKKVLLL